MSISVEFRDVSFAYPGQALLFQRLNLDLAHAKTVLLTGENGLGKSTLAALATGWLKPSQGQILRIGSDGQKLSAQDICQHITPLWQQTVLNLLGANPKQDLRLWLRAGLLTEQQAQILIESALDKWDLVKKLATPVWELSAGELKCLALAGISLFPRRYWILDEPAANLDQRHLGRLLDMLDYKREQDTGLLIITHQPALFRDLADEVISLLPEGRIELEG